MHANTWVTQQVGLSAPSAFGGDQRQEIRRGTRRFESYDDRPRKRSAAFNAVQDVCSGECSTANELNDEMRSWPRAAQQHH